MDIVERLKIAYSDLNTSLGWDHVLKYGAAALGAYTVYNFGVKPFLSPLRQMPGPGYGPIFGNVREAMIGEAMETSVGWVKKYGGVVHFYHLLGRDRVLVADPAALRHVLVTNESNYGRATAAIIVGNDSIFTATGDEHKFLRRLMNEFFTRDSVNAHLSAFHSYGERLVDKWEESLLGNSEVKVAVTTDLKKLALDILGKTVFGADINSLAEESDISDALQKFTSAQLISFTQLIPFYSWLPTKGNKDQAKNIQMLDDYLYGLINEKKKQFQDLNESEGHPKDIMWKMMNATDSETGRQFNDKNIRDNILSLFVAGHETTAVTLSWLLLTLAQNPEIQEKLRAEVKVKFPPRGQEASSQEIENMTYLNAVIKEAQRLFPAAPTFTRRAKNDDVIQGYPVPKGTPVTYHVGAMMRDPKIWPNPEKFEPERFLGDKEHDLYTHIPFSTGPHTCLGHQFAKMEMKHVLATLIREFKFKLVPGMKFIKKLRVTLNPSPPVELLIEKNT